MSRVTVEPRAATMLKKLRALEGMIESPAPILEEIGDVARKSTVSRFFKQTSPTGRRWKPSKAARRRKGLTLIRTRDLVESFRSEVTRDKLQVGTDIWYARIHQQGGPIDARYKRKSGRTGIPKLPRLGALNPGVGSPRRLAQAALRRQRTRGRQDARQVKLPRRAFLGFDKRDRKLTTKIAIERIQGSAAMSIAKAEDWLVAVVKDVVGANVEVVTGPHDFDGSFLKSVVPDLPCVVIVFDGGVAADGTSLTLDATWTLHILAGWQGGSPASRRRTAITGAYAIAQALMVRLHTTNMGERQFSASGTGRAVPNIPDLDDLDGFGKIQSRRSSTRAPANGSHGRRALLAGT